jgi:uncharacterized protein YqjF (DUF2071 family)
MSKEFLTAEWNNLIMANYEVNESFLLPLVPAHTQPDTFNGKHFISLVGFMFNDVKLKGIPVPFHRNFPEVNLRFYVKHFDGKEWKRGVVFISEIVPKPAITIIANVLYKEKYRTMPMKTLIDKSGDSYQFGYEWKYKQEWYNIKAETLASAVPMQAGSESEFITQHFWGYAKLTEKKTNEYQVAHPQWNLFPLKAFDLHCRFDILYGNKYSFLNERHPDSVFVAQGSPITIYGKSVL